MTKMAAWAALFLWGPGHELQLELISSEGSGIVCRGEQRGWIRVVGYTRMHRNLSNSGMGVNIVLFSR